MPDITQQFTPEEIEWLKSQGVDPSQARLADAPSEGQDHQMGIGQSVLARLKANAGGTIGGGAGAIGGGLLGAEVGALGGPAAPITIPVGGIIGAIGGGLGGGAVGQKVQEAILPSDVTSRLNQESAEAQQEHPYVSAGTDIASSAIASGGSFSPRTLLKAGGGLRDIIKGVANEEGRNALANVATQAGVVPAINAGVQYATTGQLPSIGDVGEQAIGGALFAKPNFIAQKLGSLRGVNDTDKVEPTPEVTDDHTEGSQEHQYASDWLNPSVIGDQQINDAYKLIMNRQKPSKPADAYNNPEYYKQLTAWQEKLKASPEEKRQTVHDQWLKQQQAAEQIKDTATSVPEVRIPPTENSVNEVVNKVPETVTPSQDLGAERDKLQEDTVNKLNEESQPFAEGEGPNEANEHLATGNTEQTINQRALDFEKARAELVAKQHEQATPQPEQQIPTDKAGAAALLSKGGVQPFQPGSQVGRPEQRAGGVPTKFTTTPAKAKANEQKITKAANQLGVDTRTPEERLQDEMEGNKGAKYSKEDDIAQYHELLKQKNELINSGKFMNEDGEFTPEFMDLWKKMEDIKNKHQGHVPQSQTELIRHYGVEATPVKIVDHIMYGDNKGPATTGSVIKMFADTAGHPFQPLAKFLSQTMDSKSRQVPWSTYMGERSHYLPSENVVEMNHIQAFHAPTVFEEALHSMTSAKLPKEWNGLRGARLKEAMDRFVANDPNSPISQLIKAYYDTAKHLGQDKILFGKDVIHPTEKTLEAGVSGEPDLAHSVGLPYAMGDLHEFIAHAFKNKEFQETLNSIKASGNKTIWQRVIDAITHLLGMPVKAGNMLDHVLRQAAELINQERTTSNAIQEQSTSRILPRERQEVGEAGSEYQRMGQSNEGEEVTGESSEAGNRKNIEAKSGLPAKQGYGSTTKEPEQLSSKSFGRVGRVFASVLDRIRAIPHEGAKGLADAYHKALNDRQGYIGKWYNRSLESGARLSKGDLYQLQKAIENFRLTGKIPSGLSTKAKAWFDTNKKIIQEVGNEHRALKMPIQVGNSKRLMIQDPNHWPTMANQKVEEVFRKGEDTARINALRKEWLDFATKKLGQSPKEAADHLKAWETSIKGSVEGGTLTHLDYFNALRKAQGQMLPPSFREQNPIRNMARYLDRTATAMVHYKDVESNHRVMATLGAQKDAWGNTIQPNKEGPIANNPHVKAALGQFHSVPGGVAEHTEEAASSLATSIFISSPGLEVHKIGSNVIKSLLTSTQFSPNPYYAVKALAAGISNIREGWGNAKKGGLVKIPATNALDMFDASLSAHQRMGGLARAIRGIATLGDLTTKLNAGFTQAYFENLIPSIINRANAGDANAARMLRHWEPSYKQGNKFTIEQQQRLASIAASYIHGTGDIRQMPKWMMNESEISGFLQLAHWSVAQTNSFFHDVYVPATRGNLTPLVTGLFGTAAAGYMIKEIREAMQGKHGQIPSLKEISASEGGLEGHAGLLAYNMIAGMQYAGFAGLLSQIAKYPFDAVYKNNPQGATFPLDEIGSDVIGDLHHIATAIATDPNVNYGELAARFALNMFGHNIKLANIALNQGVNTGFITGTTAERKMLSDKMGELRRFDMIQDLPYNEIDEASNPYMNLEARKFKLEQNPEKAAHQVPGMLNNLIAKYGHTPDVLKEKLQGLKQNTYETMPNPETLPIEFVRYVQYLQRENGQEAAQAAIADYMKHRMINKTKAAMIP